MALQPPGHGLHPGVVEAHEIDHPLIGRQAKKPRLRIAWLWTRRNRAHLHEAKAQVAPAISHQGVFVKARRQAHGVFESQPKELPPQRRMLVAKACSHQFAQARQGGAQPQGAHAQVVDLFRIEVEQQWPDEGLVHGGAELKIAS